MSAHEQTLFGLVESLMEKEPQSDFIWREYPAIATHIAAQKVRAAQTIIGATNET